MSKRPVEIKLYIEPDRIDGFIMDIRDASPDSNPKKDDWHKLLADSVEDQAARQIENNCGCNECGCGKEVKELSNQSEIIKGDQGSVKYFGLDNTGKVYVSESVVFSLKGNTQLRG